MQPLLQLADLQWMYYWQKELFAGICTSKKSSAVINTSNTDSISLKNINEEPFNNQGRSVR